MGLNWFDAAKAKEFGTALGVIFIEKVPVDSSQKIDCLLYTSPSPRD